MKRRTAVIGLLLGVAAVASIISLGPLLRAESRSDNRSLQGRSPARGCALDVGALVQDLGLVPAGAPVEARWQVRNPCEAPVLLTSQTANCGACSLRLEIDGKAIDQFFDGVSVELQPGKEAVLLWSTRSAGGAKDRRRQEVLLGSRLGSHGWQHRFIAYFSVEEAPLIDRYETLFGYHWYRVRLGQPTAFALSGPPDGMIMMVPEDASMESWLVGAPVWHQSAPVLLLSRWGRPDSRVSLTSNR